MFLFVLLFQKLLCGEKEDASTENNMTAELMKRYRTLKRMPTSLSSAEASLGIAEDMNGKSQATVIFIVSAHVSPLVASLFLLMTY